MANDEIAKLAIGTAQFGLDYGVTNNFGKLTLDEANRVITKCRECGVYALDTAIDYGSSENTLGKIGIEEQN